MQAGFPSRFWQNVTQQVERELGIPAKNVLITATHTHSVPGQQAAAYVQKIVESVRLAKQRLAPARIGYGILEGFRQQLANSLCIHNWSANMSTRSSVHVTAMLRAAVVLTLSCMRLSAPHF